MAFCCSKTIGNYEHPFATLTFAALPTPLKASTSNLDAIPGMNGLPGAETTAYDVLFAGMLATNVLLM